jgi:hypothetical protein
VGCQRCPYHPSGRVRHAFPVDFFAEATPANVAAEAWLVPDFVNADGYYLMAFTPL